MNAGAVTGRCTFVSFCCLFGVAVMRARAFCCYLFAVIHSCLSQPRSLISLLFCLSCVCSALYVSTTPGGASAGLHRMSASLAGPLIQISEEFQQALTKVEAEKAAALTEVSLLQRALQSSEMQSAIVSEQFKQLMREHVRRSMLLSYLRCYAVMLHVVLLCFRVRCVCTSVCRRRCWIRSRS